MWQNIKDEDVKAELLENKQGVQRELFPLSSLNSLVKMPAFKLKNALSLVRISAPYKERPTPNKYGDPIVI